MSSNKQNVFLTRQATNLLRIIFELMVLCHHLYVAKTPWGREINSILGPIGVSGFLLISGFGVGARYKEDGEQYLGSMLKKRIPTTYGTLVATNVAYLILFFVRGQKFESVFSFIISVLYLPIFKEFVYLSNWVYFLADLLIYYIVFLIVAFLLSRKKNSLLKTALVMIGLQAALVLVLTILNSINDSSMSMRGCFLFPMGLLLANYQDEVVKFVKKYNPILICACFLWGISFVVALGDSLFIAEYVSSMFLCLGVVLLLRGYKSKNRVVDIGAKIVLFVYVSHEFVFKFFKHILPGINTNEYLLYTLIIVGIFSYTYYMLRYSKYSPLKKNKKN